MKFLKWLENNWQKDNMFPPCLDAQTALNFLTDYLLGEDWYVVDPSCQQQINTEIVSNILSKYSKNIEKKKENIIKIEKLFIIIKKMYYILIRYCYVSYIWVDNLIGRITVDGDRSIGSAIPL